MTIVILLAPMRDSDDPGALVQIASLATAPRPGELIPHRSAHRAHHREDMLVPLLRDRPVQRAPRRTVDVMPSALRLLGREPPGGVDGISFV